MAHPPSSYPAAGTWCPIQTFREATPLPACAVSSPATRAPDRQAMVRYVPEGTTNAGDGCDAERRRASRLPASVHPELAGRRVVSW